MMKTIAGEVDVQYRHMGFANFSLLTGTSRPATPCGSGSAAPSVRLHQPSYGDDAIRESSIRTSATPCRTPSTRRVQRSLLVRPGHPRRPGSTRDQFYQEGYGTTAIEYSKANELLDSMGLNER